MYKIIKWNFLYLIVLINFLHSQCDELSKFPCISTLGCEWISQIEEGLCEDLSQNECRSGKYQGCYWQYSYNDASICAGGNYILNTGICEEQSLIDVFIDKSVKYLESEFDQVLIDYLVNNGFEYIQLENEKIFKKDSFSLKYENIKLTNNGLKIENIRVESNLGNSTLTIFKSKSIGLSLSLAQLIGILEGLATESLDVFSDFSFLLEDSYIYFKENNDVIEVKLDNFSLDYKGFINQNTFEKIERYGVFPEENQLFNISLKNLEIINFISRDDDVLKESLKLLGLEDAQESMWNINSLKLMFNYLPNQNKLKIESSFDHPFLSSNLSVQSNVYFQNDFSLKNSIVKNNNAYFDVNFKFPYNEKMLMEKILGSKLGLYKIPETAKYSFSLDYYGNLLELINPENKNQFPDNIKNNLNIKSSSSIKDFTINIPGVDKENMKRGDRVNYNSFNANNFYFDLKFDNTVGMVKSQLYTDLCDFDLSIKFDLNKLLYNYLDYNERRTYARTAKMQLKSIYEASKLYRSENGANPEDVTEINDGNYLNIPHSILEKWDFEIDLDDDEYYMAGTITATSLEPMEDGAGNQLVFDVLTERFIGYGQKGDINSLSSWNIDLTFIVSNMKSQAEEYIYLIETLNNLTFERFNNNIKINVSGDINDPKIKGYSFNVIEPIKKSSKAQIQKKKNKLDNDYNDEGYFNSDIKFLNDLIELNPNFPYNNDITTLTNDWSKQVVWEGGRIKKLFLYESNITNIPESISHLTELQKLSLWGNSLQSLPSSICDLRKTTFALGGNELCEMYHYECISSPEWNYPIEQDQSNCCESDSKKKWKICEKEHNSNEFIPYDQAPKPKTSLSDLIIYPELAKEAGIEGKVYVKAFISVKGMVEAAKILKGIPNSGLDEAALVAVKKSKWYPARQRDKRVGVWITIPIDFSLEN